MAFCLSMQVYVEGLWGEDDFSSGLQVHRFSWVCRYCTYTHRCMCMYTYTSSTGICTVVYRYVDFHGFVGTAHIRTGICACTRKRPVQVYAQISMICCLRLGMAAILPFAIMVGYGGFSGLCVLCAFAHMCLYTHTLRYRYLCMYVYFCTHVYLHEPIQV